MALSPAHQLVLLLIYYNKYEYPTCLLYVSRTRVRQTSQDCASGSVGDFMNFIARALVSQLQNVVEFISSLSAVVVPLYWVSGEIFLTRQSSV